MLADLVPCEKLTLPTAPAMSPPALSLSPARSLLHRWQSLRFVIALAVVVGVALASFASYLEQVADLRERHVQETQAELERLGTLAALALREPLWQFAEDQANSIMEAAFTNPDVVSIAIWDSAGLPFAGRQRPAEDPQLVVTSTRAVERSGAAVGKLTIVMSTAGYLRTVDMVRGQYLRGGVKTSLGALLVILLLMHWRLVRPLERLVRASQRIEKGQLDVPIRRVFPDEVGALADSLEVTRQAIIHLIAQLENRNLALTDANEHLEQRVAERTDSLAKALLALERAQKDMIETEKLASLGRVVAGVAHELNTPLGNALTTVSTLDFELTGLRAELESGSMRRSALVTFMDRAQEGLALSESNLQRAAHLIANFKQVAVDQIGDQRRKFDVAQVTTDVINVLMPMIRKCGCQMELLLQDDLECDTFPGGYGQVLTNLVVNALTHAFEPSAPGCITVRVGPVGSDAFELVVSDNGVGMDESVRTHVFDPFFTTKMGRGGTGLGMNIVHGLVTRVLKGHIVVTSAPGQGTQVRVVMPRTVDAGVMTI